MKKIVFFLFLSSGGWVFGQGSLGEIIGSVIDSKDNSALTSAKVWVEDNGKLYQTRTDVDGRFRISAVPAGKYLVSIATIDDTMKGFPVEVVPDGFGNTGIIRFTSAKIIPDIIIDGGLAKARIAITAIPVFTLQAKDLIRSPDKLSITKLVTAMTTDVKVNDDGELMFRGARTGDMLYLIDGVKTRTIGAMPSSAIGNILVYTGGMPAKYGDTLGGVIVLETKSYFDLLRERNAN